MDRKIFYDSVRSAPFPGTLTQEQVDGMNVILDEWDKRALTERSWLAYMLATAYHETARTMQPVIETFNPAHDKVNPSVDTAIARLDNAWNAGRLRWVKQPYWRKDANGMSWLGRGFVQLTHKTNYQNAQTKTGIACTARPELMLQAGPAATVMYDGMIEGWFTSHKLSDYLGNGKRDFVRARKIINGLDRAQDIAGYAVHFLVAVRAASAPVSV
jgi:predicted chitinase